MMNIYSGSVVTDASGLATVKLPDHFEVLNRDFRYQFTVVRQFPQAMVLQKVHHHSFDIETGKPGVEVSWQVTGTRQDAYANAHCIPVEVDKSAEEKGTTCIRNCSEPVPTLQSRHTNKTPVNSGQATRSNS